MSNSTDSRPGRGRTAGLPQGWRRVGRGGTALAVGAAAAVVGVLGLPAAHAAPGRSTSAHTSDGAVRGSTSSAWAGWGTSPLPGAPSGAAAHTSSSGSE